MRTFSSMRSEGYSAHYGGVFCEAVRRSAVLRDSCEVCDYLPKYIYFSERMIRGGHFVLRDYISGRK